jgi:hypothetical protein
MNLPISTVAAERRVGLVALGLLMKYLGWMGLIGKSLLLGILAF